MVTALLLPLLLAGDPVGARAQASDDPAVQLWISNDRRFLQGDRAEVHVRAEDDGYLIVLHADPDGHLRVLFPLDPGDDHFVRGGKKYEVRDRGDREAFTVNVSSGRGTVYAAVSHVPFSFQGYVLGDHWDYGTLSAGRLPREPETELTEIVRRMAGGSFDYDILTYDVIERVVYADDYSGSRSGYGSYYGSYYNDYWCCSGISFGIFFGSPYRRHYRPYYHGYYPLYDPFFYDPYYYRPVHYYPYNRYYGYYRPHYPRYRNYYSWPRYHGYAQPYTPYRFRGKDGFTAGFHDRNYGFRRAVNTVYHPPITRMREPENSRPARRLVDDRALAGSADIENRRESARRDDPKGETMRGSRPARERAAPERRSIAARSEPPEGRRIEGRRAREPERMRSVVPDARERLAGETRNLPVEVGRPRVERRSIDREPIRVVRPSQVDARPARRAEDRPQPGRGEPRAYDRGDHGGARSVDRGHGGGWGERSSPPRSGASDGGRRSAGGHGDGGGGARGSSRRR